VNNGTSLDTNRRRVYHGGGGTPGPCTVSASCVTSYADMVTASMIGNASFNSLQATLDKKMSHGLYFLANLTWSKTTDDMPRATRGNMANMNPVESYVYPVYPDDAVGIPAAARVADVKALDRGLSDIDHPLVFSLSYRWDLPKLKVGNGFLKAITNGWAISGTASRRSGDTLIAYSGSDTSKTSLGQDRAQYDASKDAYYNYIYGGGKTNCQAGRSCVQWINPAAFSQPIMNGPGTGFGNVGKSLLRGPGYFNMDGAVAREFRFWREGTKLQFRAEYFNLLNHTNLRNPVTMSANSNAFGSIVNAYEPRIAQFALKFIF
jgi:hypothetical protein